MLNKIANGVKSIRKTFILAEVYKSNEKAIEYWNEEFKSEFEGQVRDFDKEQLKEEVNKVKVMLEQTLEKQQGKAKLCTLQIEYLEERIEALDDAKREAKRLENVKRDSDSFARVWAKEEDQQNNPSRQTSNSEFEYGLGDFFVEESNEKESDDESEGATFKTEEEFRKHVNEAVSDVDAVLEKERAEARRKQAEEERKAKADREALEAELAHAESENAEMQKALKAQADEVEAAKREAEALTARAEAAEAAREAEAGHSRALEAALREAEAREHTFTTVTQVDERLDHRPQRLAPNFFSRSEGIVCTPETSIVATRTVDESKLITFPSGEFTSVYDDVITLKNVSIDTKAAVEKTNLDLFYFLDHVQEVPKLFETLAYSLIDLYKGEEDQIYLQRMTPYRKQQVFAVLHHVNINTFGFDSEMICNYASEKIKKGETFTSIFGKLEENAQAHNSRFLSFSQDYKGAEKDFKRNGGSVSVSPIEGVLGCTIIVNGERYDVIAQLDLS